VSLGNWLDFSGGPMEAFVAGVLGLVGLAALVYSLARLRGRSSELVEYTVFLLLLVGSALGVVYARNLLVVFAMWELATFALWRLVAFFRTEDDVSASAWAWYVNFGAATLMLVGLALILVENGSLSLDELSGQAVSWAPAALVLIGILAKSATLPLHVWLPRAYRAAPAPVCALLSGIAENLGVVLFLKLFVGTLVPPIGFMEFVAVLALVSSLVAGGMALVSGSTRSVLAYSTIGQLGFMFLGLAVAGYYGIMGAVLYVAAHAVAKSGLFFAVGTVEDATGKTALDDLGGLARRSPVLAGAAAMLVLSIVGIPPFLGFFAKLGVLIAVVRQNLALGLAAVGSALFTVLYLTRLYSRVFLGVTTERESASVSHLSVVLVVVMAIVSLAAGIFYNVSVNLLETSVVGLAGVM
jgi:formate hydrogenlyase subunit 3/multisubunit Na+/H+ antiporter MnhD subunit